jgi:hypothetical protein
MRDLLNSKTLGGIGLAEHWQWNPSDQITKTAVEVFSESNNQAAQNPTVKQEKGKHESSAREQERPERTNQWQEFTSGPARATRICLEENTNEQLGRRVNRRPKEWTNAHHSGREKPLVTKIDS